MKILTASMVFMILFMLSSSSQAQMSSLKEESPLREESREAFEASLLCRFQCRAEEGPRVVTLKHSFDPSVDGYNLGKGNGNLYRKLSTYLWQWGEQACLLKAQRDCGSLEKVLSFHLDRMSSGEGQSQWLLDAPPSCDESTRKVQLSPYDASRKLTITDKKADLELDPKAVAIGKVLSDEDSVASCKGPIIQGRLCYGDCLMIDEMSENCPKGSQTLCTAKSGVSENVRVCGSDILEKFTESMAQSREVAEFECRKAFIASLDAAGSRYHVIMGCAAARAEIDCRAFVEDLRKKFPQNKMSETPKPSKLNQPAHKSGESECCQVQ
jgi:hypothetical protein